MAQSQPASNPQKDQNAKIFQDYIKDKKILIADPSAVSRSSLANLLTTMGAKTAQITLVPNFQAAEQEIERVKPHVVICDYDLGKSCGLNLLQQAKAHYSDAKQSLFILVTGNTSQTAVARAAEEDVDTFVIKPFTPAVFKQSIIRAALLKIAPPEYVKVLERGKDELARAEVDTAIKTFQHAMTLDPAPSLACFYLGQANQMKKALDGAEGNFLKGLAYNKIHYKCLVGLYEVLMERKRYADAYDVIKRISHYFPANPQRLTAVLRLAIMNQAYEDVERYYRIFTTIDDRNDEIIRYICAALAVCGKFYLQKNLGSRALELFQKAASTAGSKTHILREIVIALLEFDLVKPADEYLKKFPLDTHGSADYLVSKVLLADKTQPPSMVVEQGRDALSKGVHDPLLYQVLIRRSAQAGLGAAAEDLVRDATQRFPAQKDAFQKAIATKPAKNA